MLTPCKKLYYAIEAVLFIAYNASPRPVSSRDIARRQGLPARYLEQIMQKLVHGGILKGVRGPKGGYLLAKDRRHITLGEICTLINDTDIIHHVPPTTPLGEHIVRPYWERLCGELECQLQEVTIADLCVEATEKKIEKAGKNSNDTL